MTANPRISVGVDAAERQRTVASTLPFPFAVSGRHNRHPNPYAPSCRWSRNGDRVFSPCRSFCALRPSGWGSNGLHPRSPGGASIGGLRGGFARGQPDRLYR